MSNIPAVSRRNLFLTPAAVPFMATPAKAQRQTRGSIAAPSEGVSWEMSPGRIMTFRVMSTATDNALSAFEEIVPPGEGTPLHIHRTSDELIHLSEGELTFRMEDRVTTARPGTWIFIPRGAAHGWKNKGTTPVRASFIFTPADGAKLFEESRLIGPMSPSNMPGVIPLMKKYGYELVSLEW